MDEAARDALEAELGSERTLPDVVIDGTTVDDWRTLLEIIEHEGWRTRFVVDTEERPAPDDVGELFDPDRSWSIAVWILPSVQINIFPFDATSIDFDFDTSDLGGGGFDAIAAFARRIGRAAGRPVRFSHEGEPPAVFLEYDPDLDEFRTL